MRCWSLSLSRISIRLALLSTSFAAAQITMAQPPPPQSARQALIEMFFGEAPGHVEKHLPEITRQTLGKLGGVGNQGIPGMFSALSTQAKAGGGKVETFDVGPTLFKARGLAGRKDDAIEITVERDDLVSGEDQIELALHMTEGGKEETLLPLILRFTFSMKMESEVWRLNEISATAHFPIADPSFLKALEEHQARQNEQMSLFAVRSIIAAEKSYQSAQGSFACKLSALSGSGKDAPRHNYLFDAKLASGKKNGYIFTITECDPTHYRLGAEPEARDLGQRAYCTDETGTVRASTDGKAVTCFMSGEVVENKSAAIGMLQAAPSGSSSASASAQPGGRVRVSQGVATGLLISKVQPVYPPLARNARVQGSVVMRAQINETGDVVNLELVSGDPMLAPGAMEAVKQWKYRPYVLNGRAVSVEAQVTVNFTLKER